MEEPSAYARALRPDRPRMLECLVTLTSAPERVCREVLNEAPNDPVAVVLARHYAQANVPFTGHVDLREAWEMIAPAAWLGDDRRAFLDARDATADVPARRLDALHLASDPAGMLAAESLADESLRRLAAAGVETGVTSAKPRALWRCERPTRLRTRFDPGSEAVASRFEDLLRGLSREVTLSAERASERVLRELAPRLGGCAFDAASVHRWSLLCAPMGERNPFTPLRSIWESGYALDGFAPDGFILVAPTPDGGP